MAPNRNNSFWNKLSQKMHFKSTTNAFQQKYKGTSLKTDKNDEKSFTVKIHFYQAMVVAKVDMDFF